MLRRLVLAATLLTTPAVGAKRYLKPRPNGAARGARSPAVNPRRRDRREA